MRNAAGCSVVYKGCSGDERVDISAPTLHSVSVARYSAHRVCGGVRVQGGGVLGTGSGFWRSTINEQTRETVAKTLGA